MHKLCVQQLLATIYSAITVDSATHTWFLLCQDIKLEPTRWDVPFVLFLSILHPAKYESE